MRSSRIASNPVVISAIFLGALTAYALITGAQLSRVTEIAIYALYGMGLNLMLGYTGLVAFGASVFFGAAGYASALFTQYVFPSEFAAIAAGVLFCISIGLGLGLVILLRRGLYFSLLTLASSQIAFEIAFNWTGITGGENGLQNIQRVHFEAGVPFHFFVLATVLVCIWLMWALVHSPFGRTLQAIRDDEDRARSLGYNTYLTKLSIFTLSGAFIAVAGGLLVLQIKGVYANNLSWQHSGDALLMAVLGGIHHFLGPLWGAFTFVFLEEWLSVATDNWWLIFGPIIVILALLSPEGIQGLVLRAVGRPRDTLVAKGIPPRRERGAAKVVPIARADKPGQGTLLEVQNVSKNFGAIVTAKEINVSIAPVGLHSLIGPNGAGKTTFFNMLDGQLSPSSGRLIFDGVDITRMRVHTRARLGISRSFQIVRIFKRLTVFENARIAVQAVSAKRRVFWRDAYALEDLNDLTWDLLAEVGLDDKAGLICNELAHGEKRLLEIAMAIAGDSRLLLLDEPLAGLTEKDRQLVSALIRRLAESRSVLLIEHDIDRVLEISDRVTVLHQGRLIADGAPAKVAQDPAVIAAYIGGGAADADVESEAVALRRPAGQPDAGLMAPEAVLTLRDVSSGYSGSRILDGVDLKVLQGEVVALLGRNGVGKTTTLRTITGTLKCDQGTIQFQGRDLHNLAPYQINRAGVSLVPEGRRLFGNLTVQDNLLIARRSGGASMDEIYDLFPKLEILRRAKAQNLSGGERQMVAIARALMAPSQLILLDEPFEGLAPTVVAELHQAIGKLRGRASMLLVEHDLASVLTLADRVYVLVNGKVAFEGAAVELKQDKELQSRLLGVA